jgi:hypothetical protein
MRTKNKPNVFLIESAHASIDLELVTSDLKANAFPCLSRIDLATASAFVLKLVYY